MIILSIINDSEKNHFQIAISTQGLGFITMVVAFLLVSRVNIGLGRFNEARSNLEILYRETRELVQNVCVLSNHDTSEQAKAWRHELSYRLLLLLRTSMAVIDYPTDFIAAWDIPELKGEELEDIKNVLTGPCSKRWAHAERGEWENSMRVPIRIAYLLRKTIHAQDKRLQVPMVTAHENKLLASVDTFMSGYYGIRKFLTTPVPFPLVQMARTFLVWYVFSIPFAMLTDSTSSHFSRCAIVFLITFGESLHESCSF
jgi:predicted membrane chloride channel (bestrophin family)